MGFGDRLAGAWAAASDTGRKAASEIVSMSAAAIAAAWWGGVGMGADMLGVAVAKGFSILSGSPPPAVSVPCGPSPTDEIARKTQTRSHRKELIEAGLASGDPELWEVAEQLQIDMDAVEDARLANHIYCLHDARKCSPENASVVGFTNVSGDPKALGALGLTREDLYTKGSNFRATVFKRESPPFEPGYVVVFKGTDPENAEDWQNNVRQGLGAHSPYYERAVRVGDTVASKSSAHNIRFAGHSLGGGLAAAAGRATGLPATTINAAGLRSGTVERYLDSDVVVPEPDPINAYSVPGDPLTKLNKSRVLGHGITGREHSLELAAVDQGKEIDQHGVTVVERAIERRKDAAQSQLASVAPISNPRQSQ